MGFIAALLGKTGDGVSASLSRMLESASPAFADCLGIASSEGVKILQRERAILDIDSPSLLGYKLTKAMPNDQPQPISQHGYSLIFEGRLWEKSQSFDLAEAADLVGPDPEKGIRKLIAETNGSFAVAVAENGRILCGRDVVGVHPLYLGETETLAGAASNRKMLWSLGMKTESLPPGCMAEITSNGIRLEAIRDLSQPQPLAISMDDAVERLDGLLLEAVESRSRGLFSASLGFSGGIDSTLLAHYMKECGVKVDPICVGLEGSSEFEEAEEAADGLGLPIRLESFQPSDVENDLDAVLCSVEEADPMKIGVALPLRWAVTSAYRYGNRVFFSGNGSDELFGGYLKYVHAYSESAEKARQMMFTDVAKSYDINFERDYKICADSGVELRIPFADLKLTEFGLALPMEFRIPQHGSAPRKPLLRALAKRIGIPEGVVTRQKRAIQYSTGVDRELKKLAQRRGCTVSKYLAKRFDEIKRRCVIEGGC